MKIFYSIFAVFLVCFFSVLWKQTSGEISYLVGIVAKRDKILATLENYTYI